MQSITITQEHRGEVTVLSLEGTLMAKPDVQVFEEAIFHLFKRDVKRLVLELHDLKLVNSSGLGAMISAMVSAQRKGGGLILVAIEGEVERVIKSMHLDKVFTVCDNVDTAEARLR